MDVGNLPFQYGDSKNICRVVWTREIVPSSVFRTAIAFDQKERNGVNRLAIDPQKGVNIREPKRDLLARH